MIKALNEEMHHLADQIKTGEQKREKSKERIQDMLGDVQKKLKRFTHLSEINHA
jgi:uncharacterized FlaG/YvyC family protein